MSGGVDSSVAAALLVEQGYEVIGITLQLYDHGAAVGRKGACCAGQDIHDARRVGERLDIPHYVLDFEARFRNAVIEDFAQTYASGRTPIPCVRCNQRIKFRDLLEVARDLGAAGLATGHYVRKVEADTGPELHQAVDDGRDQSYFLFATTPAQLDFLHFPLGGLLKAATRKLARRLDLPVAEKPDSQDICFVPEGRYDRIVKKLRPEAGEPGEIVDEAGRHLGEHDGIAGFTVGQRRGIRVAAAGRRYVTRVEPSSRRIVVGPCEATMALQAELDEVNWLAAAPADGLSVQVKCRARQPLVPARWHARADGRAMVTFDQPQPAVAPGQALVAYAGSRLLGGGWITSAVRAAPQAS
ncbi:MAG: tRNA 2-thiouridine(34) synthase MnmA [Geminicoccaceae bacterium]|nr:tRNA 2-thiouridine(34) synthase MnmA [Geminicoccaceae bacterium]